MANTLTNQNNIFYDRLQLSNNNFNSNNNNNNNSSINNRRKFSFPATLHSSSILEVNTISARRRLSNVSDAVTRKLSYTIGWKSAQIPAQDIITQVKYSYFFFNFHNSKIKFTFEKSSIFLFYAILKFL